MQDQTKDIRKVPICLRQYVMVTFLCKELVVEIKRIKHVKLSFKLFICSVLVLYTQ